MKKNFTKRIRKGVLSFLMVLMLPAMSFAQQYNAGNPPPATPPSNVSNTQDRDQMMYQMGLTFPSMPTRVNDPNRPVDAYPGTPSNPEGADWTDSLGTGNTIVRTGHGLWNNYHDDKVCVYSPLYLLKAHDGTKITTVEQWNTIRRPEILNDVQEQIWGFFPADSVLPKVTWTVVTTTGVSNGIPYIQKAITGTIDVSRYPAVRNKPKITATLMIPAYAAGKVPVMIVLAGASSYFNDCAAHGWGVCGYTNTDLQPDNGAGLTSYLIGLVNKGQWRKPSDWGSIGAWVWGIKKLVDYFETDPNVDATHIGVSGHSRYGKTTIAAMAFDPRIFISYPSCAGSLGYKVIRRWFGQNLENSTWDQEYHWMSGNMFKWCGPLVEGQYLPRKVENLTIDGYHLLSLCAPRPVFGNSGNGGDTWQDYQGAYLSMLTASPVWNLFGKKGLITNDPKPILDSAYIKGDLAFRWHNQGHTDAPDWPAFWRFASKYLKAPYVQLSASSISLTDTTKKSSFSITSDTTWSVTSPSWIALSPSTGKYNGKVNLTIQRNLTNASRTDTIRITLPGCKEQKIAVTQSAQTLTVSPSIIAMAGAANSTAQLTVVSDTTWTVAFASSTPWLSANKTSGKNNSSITLTGQENTGAIRTDTVKLTAPGLPVQKVIVNQGVSSGTMTAIIDATNFTSVASKDTVRVTSNNVWTVSSSQSWATLSTTGGMSNNKVGITVSANTGISSRTADITVKSPGAIDQVFTITQTGASPTALWLNLSNFSFISSLNIGAGSYSNSNIWPGTNSSSFSMSSSAAWLTIPSGANGTPSNYGGTYYLAPTIAATANTSASPRTANLILNFPGTSTTFTLPVTQAGKTPDVTLSKTVSILSEAAQNDTTFVTADGAWTATKSQAWLTLVKASGHSGADTLAVSLASNTGAVRVDTVKVLATGNTTPKYFVVRQQPSGSSLSVSTTSINLGAAINSTGTFDITSNAAWAVSSSQIWLTPSVASGSGNKTITLTASQNPTTPSSRSANVTVSAVGIAPIIISVTQASAAPTIAVSDTVFNLSTDSASRVISVTSNASWTVACPKSYVLLSATSGAANGTFKFNIAQNPYTTNRSAVITVKSGSLSKVITIKQAATTPKLNITALSLNFKASVDSSTMWINTDGNYTISSNVDWITSSPRTNVGIGIGSIGMVFAKIKASANTTGAIRTAIVTVSVPGATPQNFTYTQDATTGTNDVKDITNNEVTAYPNPVSDVLYVKLSGPSTISLFNADGQLVVAKEEKSDLSEINMSGYQSGMYILKVVSSGQSITKKVIKQ